MRKGLKTIANILCGVLVVGAVAGASAALYFGDKNNGWFDEYKKPNIEQEQPENGGENETADGMFIAPETATKQMRLTARAMSASADGNNGIATYSDNSYTLTAECTPAGVTDLFEWTISGNEDEAITLTASEMSATVTCNKAFDVQKVITITSMSNSAVTASCTVDYYARLESVSVDFPNPIPLNIGTTDVSVSLVPHYSKGTIFDTTVVAGTITVSMLNDFNYGSYCRTSNGSEADCKETTVTGNNGTISFLMSPVERSSFFHLRQGAAYAGMYETYYKWFLKGCGSSDNHFKIAVSWYATRQGGTFDSGIATAYGRFDNSALLINATDVTMSNSNLLF